MFVLVCSRCLTDIAQSKIEFNVYDCSWPCPNCGRLWLSSDQIIQIEIDDKNIWLFCRWDIPDEQYKKNELEEGYILI